MVDRHLHGSRDTIIVSVPKRSAAVETCRRELSEDVSFGMGTGTLVVYRHRGVMLWYTVLYLYYYCIRYVHARERHSSCGVESICVYALPTRRIYCLPGRYLFLPSARRLIEALRRLCSRVYILVVISPFYEQPLYLYASLFPNIRAIWRCGSITPVFFFFFFENVFLHRFWGPLAVLSELCFCR